MEFFYIQRIIHRAYTMYQIKIIVIFFIVFVSILFFFFLFLTLCGVAVAHRCILLFSIIIIIVL